MSPIPRAHRSATLAILGLALLPSCASKPSDDTIREEITATLEQRLPATWAGSFMGGKATTIDTIEIQDMAKAKGLEIAWKVRARVTGTAEADLLFKREQHPFDRVGEFTFTQNDFGEWEASIHEF